MQRLTTSPAYSHDLRLLFQSGVIGGLSDRELLEHFMTRTGDTPQRAFEAIVQRHGPMVLGVCRRVLQDTQLAEDAFQATFLVLAMRADSIRKPDSLGPWLHGAAARIARKARNARPPETRVPNPSEGLASLTVAVDRSPSLECLDEEINRLPTAYRRAIVLCYLEGRTQEDAAKLLGWTKGTVSGRLARAKDLLRSRLTRRGLAPSIVAASLLTLDGTASATVPIGTAVAASRMAQSLIMGRSEVATATVVQLARACLRAMTFARLKSAMLSMLSVSVLSLGVLQAIAQSGDGKETNEPASNAPPRQKTLAQSPSSKSQLRDLPLPKQARLRLGTTRLRHEEHVTSVDFSPDGKTLMSGAWDGVVRFWDVATGIQRSELGDRNQLGVAFNVRYSPDGRKVAIGRDAGLVQLWDLEAGKEIFRSSVHKQRVQGVAFSPDGRKLATASADDSKIVVWDVNTGNQLQVINDDRLIIYRVSLTFDQEGRRLALAGSSRNGDGEMIRIWSLDQTETSVTIARAHDNGLANLCFLSGSGGLISCGNAIKPDPENPRISDLLPQIRIWNPESGKLISDFALGKVSWVDGIALARDGSFLVSSHSDRLLVWDMPAAKLRRIIPTVQNDYGSDVAAVAISPDGQFVAGKRGSPTVHLWDLKSGKELLTDETQHRERVTATVFSQNGQTVFTGGMDGTIHHWDARSGGHLRTLEMGESGKVHAIQCLKDNQTIVACSEYSKRLTGGFGGRIRVWSYDGMRILYTIDVAHRAVALAISSDQRLVAVGQWDPEREMMGKPADGKTSPSYLVEVFELQSGHRILGIQGDNVCPLSLRFSKNDKNLMMNAGDASFRIWDATTGKKLRGFRVEGPAVGGDPKAQRSLSLTGASISPDLTLAVTSSFGNDRLLFWDLESGKVRHIIQAAKNQGSHVTWAPNGRLIATVSATRNNPGGDDTSIRLWNATSGRRELLQLDTGGRHVSSLAFSPDGKSLVTGMDDTSTLIWDVSAAYTEE